MKTDDAKRIIIAFDGECLMCSRTIRWVAERDIADRIRFTRLQDSVGREMIAASDRPSLDSMLVRKDDRIIDRSSAVIAVLETIGGIWNVPAVFGNLIPRVLRDRLYDFIAAHRYQWFGKGDACALPNEALTHRLLP